MILDNIYFVIEMEGNFVAHYALRTRTNFPV